MKTSSLVSIPWASLFTLAVLCLLFNVAAAVKKENFKTCDQSGFCKRNRAYADSSQAVGAQWEAPYQLVVETIKFGKGQLQATIHKSIDAAGTTVRLPLTISFLKSGTARVTIDEEKRKSGDIELRHNSKARKERYDEAASWAIVGGLELSTEAEIVSQEALTTVIHFGPDKKFEAVITHAPFAIDFKRDGVSQIGLNDRGFLNVDHWRAKVEKVEEEKRDGEAEVEKKDGETEVEKKEADESTWWEESFGGNTDTKPRGPESVGLDVTFHGYEHVYGIPEHAGPLSLKETRGGDGKYSEPYRLYNSDVFEYDMDSPMTLYGAIPFMHAHKKDSTVGVFWLNAAETWIDIEKVEQSSSPLSLLGFGSKIDTKTHWFSESGLLDIFVFLGPTPKDVTKSYGELTGYTQLPQDFSIGYHQCRWNYVSDEDVKTVDRQMDRYSIPYDVIWLDIEYTDGKKYFTWDPDKFADPITMGEQLDKSDRKLVTIIDPHIKNEAGYQVMEEMKKKDLAVHNKEGSIYEGWCWPGSSYWIDAFNPLARKWWTTLFKYDSFKGTLSNTFIWNDMNEPSVFNGPETTMPKDNLHHGSWEHRDVHNINGMTFANATFEAILERKKGEVRRPFVLTRSFYAGSQRLGAMWTGDNQANWDHLAAAFPMILSQGIAGFPFAGADVGGFFGNPSKELLTRWYQSGAFYPFFRGHAHIDSRRREPYLAGEPYTGLITQALRLRYSLLPVWYTAFHEASVNGTPIIRPHYFEYPGDENGFSIDEQFFVGSSGLLAKPVVGEGVVTADFYLPDDEVYYDYFDYSSHSGKGMMTISAPLDKIPLLMQGGHIIPRKDRPRRSSGLMRWDPYTLVIALDKAGEATGNLYVDDGETYDYKSGAHIHRSFSLTANTLVSEDTSTKGKLTGKYLQTMKNVRIERIILVGVPAAWSGKTTVKATEAAIGSGRARILDTFDVPFEYHGAAAGKAAWAVVKNPKLSIVSDFEINFS